MYMTLSKLQNFHWITLSSSITHSFIYSINIFWLLTRCQYNGRNQEQRRLEANNQTNPIQQIPLPHPMTMDRSHQLLSILPPEHILNPLMFQPLSTTILVEARAHELRFDWLHRPSRSLMSQSRTQLWLATLLGALPAAGLRPSLLGNSTLCAKAKRPRALRRTSFDAWTWY